MSHYSLAQKPAQLSEWAKSIAEDIINHKIESPVLVYSGMSGISSATAISLNLHALGCNHGMVYIRKQGEMSHGSPVEHEHTSSKDRTYIFVDDFLDYCSTLNYCHDKMEPHHDYIKFSFLALQKRDFGYYDKLMKPEDSERAHHIKFLNTENRPIQVNIACNPSTIDEVWKRFFEDSKCPEIEYKARTYSGYCVEEMAKIKKEKSIKPKQTMPFWANNWRKQ